MCSGAAGARSSRARFRRLRIGSGVAVLASILKGRRNENCLSGTSTLGREVFTGSGGWDAGDRGASGGAGGQATRQDCGCGDCVAVYLFEVDGGTIGEAAEVEDDSDAVDGIRPH